MSDKIENIYELRPLIDEIPEDWRYRIEEIAERCSFGSANYLIRLLKKRTGKTTRELRTRNFM